MSDSDNTGFAKFVPGFDFLQNLTKGASQAVPQIPNMSSWVAPTLNVEELDKRIQELKAVHFWLDQNSKALGATVQALEVQKMTLATLKGMNFNMADIANAFTLKPTDTTASGVQKVSERAEQAEEVAHKAGAADKTAATAAAGLVDPMQLWTALTDQFQHIAAGAMKEVGKAAAMGAADQAQAATKKADAKKAAEKSAAKAPAKAAAKSTPATASKSTARRR